MIAVSSKWHNASMEQFRYQAYLKCRLDVVPPGIREGAIASSSTSFSRSDPSKVIDGFDESLQAYGSLEPNRICLDGSCALLSSTGVTNTWWSALPPATQASTVHIEFDQVYSIPGLYITWDLETMSYPTSVTLTGYDSTGTLVYSNTVTGINSVTGFFEYPMDNIKSITLTINDWANPNWRGRIAEIILGLVIAMDSINNGRIVKADSIDSSDPISNSLPTHSLNVSFRNVDQYFDPMLQTGVSKYLAARQVMTIQWGFRTDLDTLEWSPKLKYLLSTFKIPKNSKDVDMCMDNRLTLLSQDFVQGTYTGENRSLYDLATYIMTNSNVLAENDSQIPWILPDALKTLYTAAPIPCAASNVLMQYIALASCTWLSIDSVTGFIQLKVPTEIVNTNCAIQQAQELGDPTITVSDRLRSITVGVYKYAAKANAEEVGKLETILDTTTTVKIKYSADYAINVSAAVTNATIQSATYYASYAILTLVPSSSSTAVSVILTGTELVTTISYVELFLDSNVSNGRDITIEDPFITDITMATAVATYLQKYYGKRVAYSGSYLGYPQLEAGDHINYTSVYGDAVVDVTSNKITFNGAWTGTVEVI